jgi:ATP-binding cassette subfamily D (ALD) long-chain fatty acid import protein
MYLDPPPPGSEDSTGDSKGEQLFYKVANLDDRIKNADQVRSDASQQGEPDETPELQTRVALTLLC